VAEAKQHLECYNNTHILYTSALKRPYDLHLLSLRMYKDKLASWTSAFDDMLASVEMTTSERRAANVLRVWQLMIGGSIEIKMKYSSVHDDQTLYDLYDTRFGEVIGLAESVLSETDKDAKSPGTIKYRFTLDFSLVGPLYDTARSCRDPVIRRKAIHLLRAYPCREGLWDGLLAASSAERQVELEEEASMADITSSADVPGWARISIALPTFQIGQRWTTVLYTRQQPLDGSKPLQFQETIEW